MSRLHPVRQYFIERCVEDRLFAWAVDQIRHLQDTMTAVAYLVENR